MVIRSKLCIEAKGVLHRYELDKTYLRLDFRRDGRISLREIVSLFLNDQRIVALKSEITYEKQAHRLKILCDDLGDESIVELTPDRFEQFFSNRSYKPKTQRHYVSDIRAVFRFAIKKKYIEKNPATEIRTSPYKRRPPRAIDPVAIEFFMSFMTPRVLAQCMIMNYSGLRPGECLRLKVKDIEFGKSRIHVHDAKTGPGQYVHLHSKLKPILKELIEGKTLDDYLFPAPNGNGPQKCMKKGVREAVRRAKEKVKCVEKNGKSHPLKDLILTSHITPYSFDLCNKPRVINVSKQPLFTHMSSMVRSKRRSKNYSEEFYRSHNCS